MSESEIVRNESEKIADVIEKKKKGDLMDLSSDFFTLIPHDFGFRHMSQFVIKDQKTLKDKLELLQSLDDIVIANKLLEKGEDSEKSEIDANYENLKCKIIPMTEEEKDYKIVNDYLMNSHASTHHFKLKLEKAYRVEREGEKEKFTKTIPNRTLLWHGSRLTNFVGILSQGLRIAPPEAPVTGYMFGKGVYFADMVSKSAQYCYHSTSDNTGLLLLCDVALGNCNDKLYADYNANQLPADKHSTKGCGRTAPDESSTITFDGMKIPLGKGANSSVPNGSLMYNEFIVYDISQIRMKYLLKVKFA